MALPVNPVGWFEIPTNDLSRATKFYEQAFEVKLTPGDVGPYQLAFFPMEKGAPGAAGALIKGPGYVPSHQGTVIYFQVEGIDAAFKQLTAAGAKMLLPRIDIGQYGFVAQFEDCEGNRVALHEPKRECVGV